MVHISDPILNIRRDFVFCLCPPYISLLHVRSKLSAASIALFNTLIWFHMILQIRAKASVAPNVLIILTIFIFRVLLFETKQLETYIRQGLFINYYK